MSGQHNARLLSRALYYWWEPQREPGVISPALGATRRVHLLRLQGWARRWGCAGLVGKASTAGKPLQAVTASFPTWRSGPWRAGQSAKWPKSGAEQSRNECVLQTAALPGQQWVAWGHHMLQLPLPPVLARVSHTASGFLLFSTLPNICFVNSDRLTAIFICRGDYLRNPNWEVLNLSVSINNHFQRNNFP